MKMIHRGEKGFTLIELLVVIAILGVIAAVVALNVAGFFGRGTLQAANTELHQAQTAIVAAMADCESNDITGTGPYTWAGEDSVIVISGAGNCTSDASDYCYGPFRAAYTVNDEGGITGGDPDISGGWGTGIQWNSSFMNWEETP
jgi:prepilin-type N-terminal cleavage/methylation domain-containing protein